MLMFIVNRLTQQTTHTGLKINGRVFLSNEINFFVHVKIGKGFRSITLQSMYSKSFVDLNIK